MAADSSFNACVHLIDHHLQAGRGAKIAYIDPDRTLSYENLIAGTKRMVTVLKDLGLAAENRVALLMLDTVDFPVAFLGAIRAGIVPVPLNTLLGPEQYAYMLADSRARALIVSAQLYAQVAPILSSLPGLETVIVAGGPAPEGTLAFETLLDKAALAADAAETSPDEPAFWLYSSGSTGNPKGTKHVHSSMKATADLFGKGVIGMRESDVVHSAAKLFFAYGLGNALTFPLTVGATTILNPGRPTPAAVFDILEKHDVTLFCGVPTLFAAMLHDPSCAERAGSKRLRLCTSAGEALPEHIGTAFEQRFGAEIVDGLGSTEMLHIFLSNRPGDVAYGTSGRAVPGYELKLLDEQLQPVPDGEIGELYVNGPSAAEGYWNQRDKTRLTFQGDWTKTGDKYVRRADGRYVYSGRADDMFKVSGIWVSPFEVEAALISHESVLEAAVVAAPDEEELLKPKAFVVLKQGCSADGLQEALKDHVKSRIGMWKYPRWVEIIESLPKTATGKIQRYKLRDGMF